MKESEFIEQNKQKWLEFENNLLKKEGDPASTSKLFVQITDDLSYARTFYNNRSVKLYLNGIAKLLFNDINKIGRKGTSSFLNFWKKDLPLTMYEARRAMLISFFVFLSCFILGVLTSMQDKDFARAILSNDYVNKTNENIAKGDAMAVYKSEGELETFLPILYNNLKVDFLTFFSGIFMAIGSLVIMISNGVMVGVFQYFFIERGLFWPSFLTIWTHGALEISSIILSGGAGLTLGKGLLFPGTLSRLQAFKISGMNGLRIITGVAPVTLLAAFIEGFLTRHTNVPDLIRLLFIIMSFVLILIYFFYYPRKVAKRTGNEISHNPLVYMPETRFDIRVIHAAGKIITETFRQLFTGFPFFAKFLFIASVLCSFLIAYNPLELFHDYDSQSFAGVDLFRFGDYPLLAVLILICCVLLALLQLFYLKKKLAPAEENDRPKKNPYQKTIFTTILSFVLFTFIIFIDVEFTAFVAHLIFPVLVFICCVSLHQRLNFFESIAYAGSLITQSWSRFLATAATCALVSFLLFAAFAYGTHLLFINEALLWALTNDESLAEKIEMSFTAFQNFFCFFMYLTLSVISNGILYFTLQEVYTADHLKSRINDIKISK